MLEMIGYCRAAGLHKAFPRTGTTPALYLLPWRFPYYSAIISAPQTSIITSRGSQIYPKQPIETASEEKRAQRYSIYWLCWTLFWLKCILQDFHLKQQCFSTLLVDTYIKVAEKG